VYVQAAGEDGRTRYREVSLQLPLPWVRWITRKAGSPHGAGFYVISGLVQGYIYAKIIRDPMWILLEWTINAYLARGTHEDGC
jgi:hypothetical protein